MTPHRSPLNPAPPAALSLGVEHHHWTLRWRPHTGPTVEAWLTGRRLTPVDAAGDDPPGGDPVAGETTPRACIAALQQVHGAAVVTVNGPGLSPACDAAVTRQLDLTLVVRVADCVPIFLVSRAVIGVAHAGWRGTAGRIAARTVERLAEESGESPASFHALVGPSIGPCCFEVGAEVAEAFSPRFRLPRPGGPRHGLSGGGPREHVDLWAANRAQLIEAGLRPEGIQTAALCTRCHQHLFHSYRGSGGQPGRILCALRRVVPDTQPRVSERQRS